MPRLDVAAYLARLRLPELAPPAPPSADALRALHRAHVERIAYEALEIQLGRPTTVDPHESADRILEPPPRRLLLPPQRRVLAAAGALGYDVVWHRGGVQNHSDPEPVGPERANHLALTVHGLPPARTPRRATGSPTSGWATPSTARCRCARARYVQGPFRYGLRRSDVEPGGWRWDHDPAGGVRRHGLPRRARDAGRLPRCATSSSPRRRSPASSAPAASSAATRAASTCSPAAC